MKMLLGSPGFSTCYLIVLLCGWACAQGESGGGGFPDPSCPDYAQFSTEKHEPLSNGPLKLPYQRPQPKCRTFKSDLVDKTISQYTSRMADPDLARLFENCFPNTLDTTVRWHTKDVNNTYGGPRSFVITGDKNAEWLRDSRNQLYNYMSLAPFDKELRTMLQGAIYTQAEFILEAPYCNAYQPPPESGIDPMGGDHDDVHPPVDANQVYHCQFEVDTVAAFFAITNDYYRGTGDTSFLQNKVWYNAAEKYLDVIKKMQTPTFADDDTLNNASYTFQRQSSNSLATTDLDGHGNPMAPGTGLVRTFSRPSDDFGFLPILIPANAMLAVELKRTGKMLGKENNDLSKSFTELGEQIEKGVWKHGTFNHGKYGRVFAYEIDGYGSLMSMDDANIPSLLSLPDLGFLDRDDETYQNTRKMILDRQFNPYYVEGDYFSGIGGPHKGPECPPWPMANSMRIRTSDDDEEIREQLDILKNSTAGLGLMHESINAHLPLDDENSYTRPWFAWMNSEFSRTIIDLANRKPYLVFKTDMSSEISLAQAGEMASSSK